MKKAILFFALLLITIGTLFLLPEKDKGKYYPIPSSGTMVKTDMEEKDLKSNRSDWIEAMHRAAPEVDWRKVEYRTSMERQNNAETEFSSGRNGEVNIADGLLTGEWIERGSNNQAGSVFDLDYDMETNEMFLISAGGSLFKSDYYLQYWEVVNDRFKFTPGLFKILQKEDETKRLVALINKEPHFSDDMGQSWEAANAYQADNWGNIKDAFVTSFEDQSLIFILAKTSYWNDFKLYVSFDQGENYEVIKEFTTSDADNLAMTHIELSGDIFLIEQIQANKSKIFQYGPETKMMNLVYPNSPHAFGNDGRGNLAGAITKEGALKLISYNGDLELQTSIDTGATWTNMSTLPVNPWEVRLYVSTENPDLLLIGAVECYRSLNGGESWEKINGWAEYYGNVNSKLHADIMQFDEFTDQDGNTFVTISNHGGLSVSYDHTLTNQNIGLFDLNVSQYYSVRTSPKNPSFVTAGSQDQGLQRGVIHNKNTAGLEQVISGDYGHNVFTLGGESFWTVYPGGWVSHYSNPELGYLDASWDLDSDNETVWIPPIIEGPDADKDQVILAGGNKNGGFGSYLIELTYENGYIYKNQLPVNFYSASESEISAIGISPLNKDKWFVATNNGHFYYSNDRGTTFQKANNNVPGSNYLYGACILPSKIEDNVVYISGSGYSTAGVQKSVDGGRNFGSMTNGLPQTMVFGLASNEDESLLFAATEAGPYVFIREEGKWYDLAEEIAPTQSYWSVEFIEETQTARFATYGRGIWDFDLSDSGVNSETLLNAKYDELKVYPNPADEVITIGLSDHVKGKATLYVYDQIGRMITKKDIQIERDEYRMDITSLQRGHYFFILAFDNSNYSGKFIKK